MKKVLLLLLCSGMFGVASAKIIKTTYTNDDETVTMTVTVNTLLGLAKISRVVVVNTPENCTAEIKPGILKGYINSKVSMNWATYGFTYTDSYGAQANISGLVADDPTTYAKTYINIDNNVEVNGCLVNKFTQPQYLHIQ